MSVVKGYFKNEIQWRMIDVDHTKPSDFHLSVWQTNRSSTPLLVFRTLLFLTALGIMLASIVLYILANQFGYWFIYLTHWGLMVLTLTCGFSIGVSARCFFYGPISNQFNLPWYMKVYWVLFNIAVPIALLITLFYWTVLYTAGVEEELNHALDVCIHGINSVLALLLLASGSHPARLLHVYQPLLFALVFFMFSLFYYLAGGLDQNGSPWVYPVLDWRAPGPAVGVGFLTGLMLVLLYLLVIGIALARDAVSRKYVKPPTPINGGNPETLPLRTPQQTA